MRYANVIHVFYGVIIRIISSCSEAINQEWHIITIGDIQQLIECSHVMSHEELLAAFLKQ